MATKWIILHVPSGELVTTWIEREKLWPGIKQDSQKSKKIHYEFSCHGLVTDNGLDTVMYKKFEHFNTRNEASEILDILVTYLTRDLRAVKAYYVLGPEQTITINEFEIIGVK